MTIVKLLEKQQELFSKTKEDLEAAILKPSDVRAPIKETEKTIERLRLRVASLKQEKKTAVQTFDRKIKFYESDIKRLESKIKKDRSILDADAVAGRKTKKTKPKQKKNA
jgi:t-SNARE complex subunit (syntaxin)